MSHAIRMGTLVVALMLASATPASALERFVRPDADPTCLATANCHLTIGAAAAAAGNGDVITIGHNGGAPYTENIAFGGRTDVTFRGQSGAPPTVAAIAADDAPVFFISAGADRTTISHLTMSASPGDGAVRVAAGTTGAVVADAAASCAGVAECLRLEGPSPSVADTNVAVTDIGVPIRLYQGGALLRVTTIGGPVSIVALSPQDPASVVASSVTSPAAGLLLSGFAGTVSRTRVASDLGTAIQIQGSGATWSIANSLLTGAAGGVGVLELLGSTTTTLRNVTLAGAGRAVSILTFAPIAAQLGATNTVLRGDAGDVYVDPDSTATPALTFSNSALRGLAAGSATAPLHGTGNAGGDPQFAGPADFHVVDGSPLVDAGAAVPPGDLDLDGVARPRGLAPDIGAFESPFSRPIAAAPLPPPPPPGAPPPPPPPAPRPAAPAVRLPVLSALTIRPSTFRAAASGPSVRPGSTRSAGTTVSFRLDVPARVTFTAQRRTPGVRSNGRCVKRTARARGRSCTRYVAQAGSFSRDAKAGRTTLRFTGRLDGRRLARGAYRLTGRARAGDATGRPRRATFRIR